MSFESLTLENYGLELVGNDSEDSDEDPCYGEKCISTFRLLLDDIQAKNNGSHQHIEGHACCQAAEQVVNQVVKQVLTSDQDPDEQMVISRAYCSPVPPDQQAKSSNNNKTIPTIPDVTATLQEATTAAKRANNEGGASMCSTLSTASPFTQAADQHQQFSSTNVDNSVEEPKVVIRQRPLVPPKPQIDLIRYSMANAKDDLDLDTILSELLELENQLAGDAGDQMLMGITPLVHPSSSSNQISSQAIATKTNEIKAPNSLRHAEPAILQRRNPESTVLKTNFVVASRANNTEICASPIDSAYGECSSNESSDRNRNRNSEISSGGSYGSSLNTPSPTNQGSPKSNGSTSGSTNELEHQAPLAKPMTDAEIKAAKIREALDKLKEAKIKKIYAKFFLEDNSTKGLLIDERWTVKETMQQLANKLGVVLTPEHAIVEEYPELHIKRVYEDHEYVVENIEDWLQDSKNKLYFIRRMDKYCFIHKPEHYLLTEKIEFEFPAANAEWTSQQRSDLLQKYFDNESLAPELEGWLMLKSDGRKSWKKHYFVLRSSGLYYCPKGNKRSAKDLQCLMNVYNNQVYTCTDWRKKYKAPTNFGFAIKHPKIQVKTSKYIKYICTEDEVSYKKWIAALRIIKNGCNCLEKNFRTTLDEMQKAAVSKPIHVDTHNQIHQRLPILDFHSNSSNGFPTRPQTAQSINSVNSIRTSVHSRQENGHPGTAFDQDDCGTIKRQPADPLCNSLSTSTFNSNLYTQRSSHSPVIISSNSSSMHSESSRNQTVNAEVHNGSFAIASAYPKTVNFANCGDLDSDEEEHFPPPPEVHPKQQNVSTPQSIYQNGNGIQRNSQPSFASPVPAPIQNVQFRASKPPILTPKPTLQQNFSPANLSRSSAKAPAPPKRSENTRVQTASLMNEEHKQQMALFNELQYKIQARHNQQIDTN